MYFSFLFGRQNTTHRPSRPSRRNGKRQNARRPILERLENRSLLAGFPFALAGTGNDSGGSVAIDTSGNVFVGGSFDGTMDFDPGPGTANLNSSLKDGFLARYSADGTLAWARRFGGNKFTYPGTTVVVDTIGNT